MKYKISINKPCQENWNAMSPTEQGAFCAVCKKDVVDFTNLPVNQFKKKLKNNSCGRFTAKQLEQEYEFGESSRFSRVAAAIGFTAFLAGTGAAYGQTSVPKTEQRDINGKVATKVDKEKIIQDTVTIKGRVQDIAGDGLFGATIRITNTNTATTTDFDGNYMLQINNYDKSIGLLLKIESLGYHYQDLKIKHNLENTTVLIENEDEELIYLGYRVITKVKTRRTFFGRLFNVFRKRENRY